MIPRRLPSSHENPGAPTSQQLRTPLDAAVLANGASYGDIANVCGVSRQAARQRWLRRRQRRDVRTIRPVSGLRAVSWDGIWPTNNYSGYEVHLVGGPLDGQRATVRQGNTYKMEVSPDEAGTPGPMTASYIPADDDLNVYTFEKLEPAPERLARPRLPRDKRVYEIAADLGVSSRTILHRLHAMGEYVRSASAVIKPDMQDQLRDYFQPKDDNQGPPGEM
jgi:hypothetical protein